MGDEHEGGGGGVFVHLNTGKQGAPVFDAPRALIAAGTHAGHDVAMRPDSGYYADAADFDGDGDLDLGVGGYSNWIAKEPALTDEQKARVTVLKKDLEDCESATQALYDELDELVDKLEKAEAKTKSDAYSKAHEDEFAALSKRRKAITKELDPLVGGEKRAAYVWLYENTTAKSPAATR